MFRRQANLNLACEKSNRKVLERKREREERGEMASRALLLSCINGDGAAFSTSRLLSPRPRYPSMPKYPKEPSSSSSSSAAADLCGGGGDVEAPAPDAEGEKKRRAVAVFSVTGVACAACAGSVEKAVKRLPGIHDAAVDVLNNRAQVIFYPAFVSVSFLFPPTFLTIYPPKFYLILDLRFAFSNLQYKFDLASSGYHLVCSRSFRIPIRHNPKEVIYHID